MPEPVGPDLTYLVAISRLPIGTPAVVTPAPIMSNSDRWWPKQCGLPRPYAWRLQPGEDEAAGGRWSPSLHPGRTGSNSGFDDGTRIPVELDATGAGTTTLSDSDRATVVAYAADGRVLGETPVPPRDRRYAPVPGESAATSIVLSAN